ncbi:MAG: AI-2E family transporter [Bacteroidales bacterium]|nr:AI-2E family transporter [Bacteroidales bacterium]MBN2764536.1 AI-2E family transporter [Bacteroidales bacterium]
MKRDYPFGFRLTYVLLSIILLIYGVILAKDFLYPLAFGILLSYLLYPIVNFLEKKGIPRILAILSGIILGIVVFASIGFFIFKRISLFTDDLPLFRQKMIAHIEQFQFYINKEFGIPGDSLKEFLLSHITNLGIQSGKVFSATTGTIFKVLMQPVYVFLFLYYRTKFAYFILKVAGKDNRPIVVKILKEIATVVTRYMLGVTTVVLILCIFNSAGYLIIGIKYPLLLGVISALFSFIPYFGNFIGGAIPFLFALLTEDSMIYSLRVVIFVYIVHLIENNILSPNIVGNNVRINPFVIIIGLVMAGMIWGLPGMLVIIPFLAMLTIVFKSIPSMQPYSYLLGPRGTKRHALTLENIRKFAGRIKNKV